LGGFHRAFVQLAKNGFSCRHALMFSEF
jgi:hypothetical protein